MPFFEYARGIEINHCTFLDVTGNRNVYYGAGDSPVWGENDIRRLIAAPDYERDLRNANEKYHRGTCKWLSNKLEYARWREGGTPFLVIYGIAGAGKTILASWIIEKIRAADPGHMILYHFFRHADHSKDTPIAAARSFLEQVYNKFPSAFELELSNINHKLRNMYEEFETIWDILRSALVSFSKRSEFDSQPRDVLQDTTSSTGTPHPTQPGCEPHLTIILDALDECKHSEQLIRSLRRLVHGANGVIRIIITARKSGDHIRELMKSHPDQCQPSFLDITQDDVQHDITSFVEHSIHNVTHLDSENHEDLRNIIITTLSDVRHHQGMFLWAHLMCTEVKQLHTVEEIEILLDHKMPPGLEVICENICKRLSSVSWLPAGYHESVDSALQWVLVSKRSMRFVELKAALRMMHKDSELISSPRDINEILGDILRYSNEEDTIIPLHPLQQFFCTPPLTLEKIYPHLSMRVVQPFLVDIPNAELMIAKTCLEYLFSTSLHSDQYLSSLALPKMFDAIPAQDNFRDYPLLKYSVTHWPEYALNRLEAQTGQNSDSIQLLLATVTKFARSPASIIWLEELIHVMPIDSVQRIIDHFISLDSPFVSGELSSWSHLVKTVFAVSATLPPPPQVAILYANFQRGWLQASSNYGSPNLGLPHLEEREGHERDLGIMTTGATPDVFSPILRLAPTGALVDNPVGSTPQLERSAYENPENNTQMELVNGTIHSNLPQLQSVVGQQEHSERVRERVIWRLNEVFKDTLKYKRLLQARDLEAQAFLDTFQALLDSNGSNADFRRNLVVATKRLSRSTGLYPACYNLENIELKTDDAFAAGSFGDIYKGSLSGQDVCLKVIRLYQTSDADLFLKQFSAEAVLWAQLSHPNLLPICGLYRYKGRPCLVSPWMEHGDLNKYLRQYSNADRSLLVLDVASGVQYLHVNDIIHGDLKGVNILVDYFGRACLCDFGLSAISDTNILHWASHSSAASRGGTARWQAPELIDWEKDEAVHNSKASDVYAVACVAYEVFAGDLPFFEHALDSTVTLKVKQGERPSRPPASSPAWGSWGLTEATWCMMEAGWRGNHLDRPTIDDIVAYFKTQAPVDERPGPPLGSASFIRFRDSSAKLPPIEDIEFLLDGIQ